VPIVERSGSIFTTQADVIVNTVNCAGAMGAGIALEVRTEVSRGLSGATRSSASAARSPSPLSAGDCNTGLVGCLLMVRELEGVDAGCTSVVGGA
jgi:O-acetyl-ADP-ribose deacetylase (regulator of RNase III)